MDRYVQFTLLEVDVDGHPTVWQLYTPEQMQYQDPNLYLWIRRCELFNSIEAVRKHLERLGIDIVSESQHELFQELIILTDVRGFQWYMCTAPIRNTFP